MVTTVNLTWVRCEDALPGPTDMVLCRIRQGNILIGRLSEQFVSFHDTDGWKMSLITHWARIPIDAIERSVRSGIGS